MDNNVLALALIPAVISAIISGGIAYFSAKRIEDKKYDREVYQNLFAPVLYEVFIYLDIKTSSRIEFSIQGNANQAYESILANIRDNLRYAGPNLISAYHNVKIWDNLEDGSGFLPDAHKLFLILTFLDEVFSLSEKINIFDRSIRKKIEMCRVLYMFLIAFLEKYNSLETASRIMQRRYAFGEDGLTNDLYQEMRAMREDRPFYQLEMSDGDFNRFMFSKVIFDREDLEDVLNTTSWAVEYYNCSEVIPSCARDDTDPQAQG